MTGLEHDPTPCAPCAELLEWYRTTPDVDPTPPPGTRPGPLVAGAVAAYHQLDHPADMAPPCRYLPCAGRGLGHVHTTGDAAAVPADVAGKTIGEMLAGGLPPAVLGFRDPAATVIRAGQVLRNIRIH